MKAIFGAAAAVLAGGGGIAAHHYGFLGSGISPDREYLVPAPTAVARLAAMQPSHHMTDLLDLGSAMGGSTETVRPTPDTIRYVFKVNGTEVGAYTATVTPTDPAASLVSTALTMAPDADRTMQGVIGNMGAQFARIGREVMDESVDAALDGRPFDETVYQRAHARYILANQAEIQGYIVGEMARAGEMMKAEARSTVDPGGPRHIHAAPVDYTTRFTPGRPMVRPTPSR